MKLCEGYFLQVFYNSLIMFNILYPVYLVQKLDIMLIQYHVYCIHYFMYIRVVITSDVFVLSRV